MGPGDCGWGMGPGGRGPGPGSVVEGLWLGGYKYKGGRSHTPKSTRLQPTTNTQKSKPRPPTADAKSKEKTLKLKQCSQLSAG